MKLLDLTELDAAIIAEEKGGWDYLPACDEGFAALNELEIETPVAAKVAAAPVNKMALRKKLIREVMPIVKGSEWGFGQDDQSIASDFGNDERFAPLFAGKDLDEVYDYLLGVCRFCEHACGYTR